MVKDFSEHVEDFVFKLWYNQHIDELRIKWAENGADRELDFNEEYEIDKEYENFKNTLRE